ncbi:MAG: phosphoribosylformylglycinamidine synthase I [Candidatus Odinarchaeota archaeon]
MTIVIPRFPATNNEYDALRVFKEVFRRAAVIVPHFNAEQIHDSRIKGIFIPGGFSYGDYIRAGAIASVSEIMTAIKQKTREEGVPVLGVCNGFQILTEANLLPGVLLKNTSTRFVCKWVSLKRENMTNPLTKGLDDEPLRLPVAHYEGRYHVEPGTLEEMMDNHQVLFHYVDSAGELSEKANPNGSVNNIAGVSDKDHRVFGMMPHPERASRKELTSTDGLPIIRNFLALIDEGI